MDGQTIVQVISTVGFPIAMCLLLFWYVKQQSDAHNQEMDKMSEAVNNNTLVLQKLVDALERKG